MAEGERPDMGLRIFIGILCLALGVKGLAQGNKDSMGVGQ
jgi:hypothetical protein